MSIADDLRRDADAALKEAGMYYSGEYLSGIADSVEAIVAENERLREAVATAIKVQTVLCGDMDMPRCREECPLHRQETDDCLACDVIEAAMEAGIEVQGGNQ